MSCYMHECDEWNATDGVLVNEVFWFAAIAQWAQHIIKWEVCGSILEDEGSNLRIFAAQSSRIGLLSINELFSHHESKYV